MDRANSAWLPKTATTSSICVCGEVVKETLSKKFGLLSSLFYDRPYGLTFQETWNIVGGMEKKRTLLPLSASRDETARRIDLTREALDITVRDITEETGISKSSWNNYVKGRSRPNVEDAIRFSVRYGVTLDWLYRGDLSGVSYKVATKIRELAALPEE